MDFSSVFMRHKVNLNQSCIRLLRTAQHSNGFEGDAFVARILRETYLLAN